MRRVEIEKRSVSSTGRRPPHPLGSDLARQDLGAYVEKAEEEASENSNGPRGCGVLSTQQI